MENTRVIAAIRYLFLRENKPEDAEEIKSVSKKWNSSWKRREQCMEWRFPKLDEPLAIKDTVLAELTRQEQGFLRCMGYAYEEKGIVDLLRLTALHETFWNTIL